MPLYAPAVMADAAWHVTIPVTLWTPDSTTGTWVWTGYDDNAVVYPFYAPGSAANSGAAVLLENSSGTLNDAITWKVSLAAGTWDITVQARVNGNCGIATISIDGLSAGDIDAYDGSASLQPLALTSIIVPTGGSHEVLVEVTDQNGLSDGFFFDIASIEFHRTA